MASAMKSIDVHVPVRVAYNQWTQMEFFPQFMEGVKEVRQLDDTHMHWIAEVGGKRQEWDAQITQQIPDQGISWTATGGDYNAGVVTFHDIDPNTTRVTVQLDYQPEGALEHAGSALGFMDRRLQADLERFKTFIESRQQETGAWRGEVQDHPDVERP
ncbi:MAG TPA: SRPBCC family protein [Ktedonobacterales bacterium]